MRNRRVVVMLLSNLLFTDSKSVLTHCRHQFAVFRIRIYMNSTNTMLSHLVPCFPKLIVSIVSNMTATLRIVGFLDMRSHYRFFLSRMVNHNKQYDYDIKKRICVAYRNIPLNYLSKFQHFRSTFLSSCSIMCSDNSISANHWTSSELNNLWYWIKYCHVYVEIIIFFDLGYVESENYALLQRIFE